MAPNATNHSPGRMGRVLHRLFPNRRRAAAELAIEVVALLLELSIVAHVAVAIVAHLMLSLCCKHRPGTMPGR